ncbi:hypothetical protein B0A55_02234 [Friedmanniomyces simplex]|uniref:Uncharacterized protein n=1 Tax=Friedmanniomyces simplex TaxID=329884 RepID=A0A4U0XN71_9PEZI|nr:hypothetical protein B0A55_02234 [Friedmanniomyces simplex]
MWPEASHLRAGNGSSRRASLLVINDWRPDQHILAAKMPFQKGADHWRNKTQNSPLIASPGNKYGGKRNRGSAFARTPSKIHDEPEDEDMMDEDAEEGVIYDEDVDEEVEEDAATPAQNEDDEEGDEDAPPTITAMPARRRGRGRGRGGVSRRNTRGERLDYGTPQPLDGDGEEGSERRGQQTEAPRQVVDKNGQALDVVDEEVQVDDDEEGNTKVDAKGNLQGGREYRVRIFKILGKENRLYMLSTEPARCCGFRDSYLFFAKHPKLWKVLLAEEEKKDLIDRDILPSSYKGRNIGVVTARSVYREFGAKIIVGGRKVTDDYKVAEARANGEVEGELADPEDRIPDNKEDYDRNRYVAWFGASEVYRTAAQGAVPGKPGPMGKRRTNVTVGNWQYMHAREASRFNSFAAAARRANLDGVYDAHTNMMFYPQIMQPTHVKWEQIPPPTASHHHQPLTNGHANGHHLTNGTTDNKNDDANDDIDIADLPSPKDQSQPTLFPPIPATISRNFAVIDTHFTSPRTTITTYPGPDGPILDSGLINGADGLTSIPPDLVDELPLDCRRDFEQARQDELRWKLQWGAEGQSAMRGGLRIGLNGYPV